MPSMKFGDTFTTILVILGGLIPLSLELIWEDKTTVTGSILLTAILAFIAFYFIYTFICSSIRVYKNQIETNTKKIYEIE